MVTNVRKQHKWELMRKSEFLDKSAGWDVKTPWVPQEKGAQDRHWSPVFPIGAFPGLLQGAFPWLTGTAEPGIPSLHGLVGMTDANMLPQSADADPVGGWGCRDHWHDPSPLWLLLISANQHVWSAFKLWFALICGWLVHAEIKGSCLRQYAKRFFPFLTPSRSQRCPIVWMFRT